MQVTPVDPVRMAETAKRYRDRVLELQKSRRHTVLLTKVPDAPPAEKPKEAAKCSAQTLEGRKCTYKATHGCFCRKHFLMK
jgi:hypothetical protein